MLLKVLPKSVFKSKKKSSLPITKLNPSIKILIIKTKYLKKEDLLFKVV